MKSKNKLFTMFFALFTFIFLGTMNVSAAGEHQFSIQAYDWNAFDNDWEGSGSGEEILDGAIVKPGQVIQIALYYVPGADTENNMQVGLMYDKDLVEPMYDSGNVFIDTDWSTTYNGGMWPAKGTSPANKKLTNWTLMSNDYVAGSYITMIVKDTTMSTTLETEGTFANIYFKVKDDAPSGSELKFYYNDDYTTIRNSRPFVSSGIDFTIQGDVSSNTALHTLTATGNGVTYTSPDFVADNNTVKEYSIVVPNSVTSIDLQATATDAKATVLAGTLGTKSLNVGNNDFIVTVAAESGAQENYKVSVYRLNNEATLSSLSLTNSVDIGTFNKDILSYTATVPYKTTSTSVSAIATDSKATVTGTGTFNFTNYGDTSNVKEVVVKAENCDSKYASVEGNTCTSKTYTVTVKRTAPSSNKNLSELKVDNVLVSGFNKGTLEYTLEDIKTNVTSLNITATAEDTNAKVTGTGSKTLNVGLNVIEVKVTAEDGTSQTYKINVKKLSSDNTLKSLSINKGTLSPGFSASTKTYTVTMDEDVTVFNENMITAVANHSGANIVYDSEKTINGDTTTAFTINVTAENGETETYTLNVKKAKNNDATLKSLTVSEGTLSPAFSAGTTSYTVNVENDITSIVVTGEANGSNANVTVTGGDVLNVGNNQVKVTVTSEAGNKKEYTINVVRKGSSDADLKEIKIDGTLINGFDKDTLNYTLDDIKTDVTKLNVTALSNHSKATVTITGADAIKVGDNTITIKVVAEDGTTTKIYTINVKKLSADNTLKSLSVNKGTLNPSFVSGTKTYIVTMEEDVTVFNENMITAVANYSGATISYDSEKTINSDTTTAFTITVTAENGETGTYTLNVKKEKNSNATLKSLTVSEGTLSPVFSAGTTSYTVNVGNEITSIVVTGEATDPTADVTVTGETSLKVGTNTVKVTVTSESGDKKEYTINVVRAASSDADLKEIKIDGTLIDEFNKDTLVYTLEDITTDITKLNVTAVANHSEADVTITGADAIKVGDNTITIKVVAEDGTTTKTYTINVKKLSADNTLKSLSVNKGTLNPSFVSGTKTYTVTMEEDVTVFNKEMITAVANYSGANIVYDAEKTINSDTTTAFTITVTAENGAVETYILNVKKEKNSNATLKSLTVSEGTLSPVFSAGTTSYTVNVGNEITSIVVTGEATDPTADVTVTGGTSLKVGTNTVKVTVTSESGDKKEYTINVVRAGSSNASLSELKVNGVSVDGFNKDTLEYTLTKVAYSVSKVNVTATAEHSEAKITGTGDINLQTGSNVIEVKVTAEDGKTTKTYKLNVEREKNNDSTLKSLSIGEFTLTPSFDKNKFEYEITVTELTEILKQSDVKAVATDSNAKITLDADLTLSSKQDNYYNIKVVAEDGVSNSTYKIKVIKPKSSDAALKSLNISGGTLSPAFTSTQKTYDVVMPNDATKFNKTMITAVANHSEAVITYSEEISINSETAKEFVITVTAENGTANTYKLNVKANAEEVLKEITSTKHTVNEDSIKTVKLYETALELKNNLDNENEYLEVWSADEATKIKDDEKLATGMIVKLIQDGKEIDRKVVVIKGDTSGDGEIDLFDAVKILNHYLEKTPLKNAYEQAAFVNNDEAVDLFDAVMILNHYLGKTSLH